MILLFVGQPLAVSFSFFERRGLPEVHVAIGSPAPQLIHVSKGLISRHVRSWIAANHTVEETRQIIGADSLTYLSLMA